MRFKVLPAGNKPSIEQPNCAYLIIDNWDDWFEFSTMYTLIYICLLYTSDAADD